jgi:EAL domain-containing protein (putative c-di-GMP-specific phosphodiesterase class I)
LTTWQVTGVEALLRWRNPDLALLGPSDFLDLAHETGLIVPIGEWVLREACRQNKAWQDAGIPPFRVGVNFSARELEDPGFISLVRRVLAETGLSPSSLEIEITEGQLIRDRETTLALLHELQVMEVNLSADDFGAGLSNLNTLKRFPVNTLKIDRSVIEHIAHSRHDSAIAAAIIGLGCDLNVRVVAEGVETLEQLAFLQAEGCTSAQGFLFSPPVSARSLEALLREGNGSRMNPQSSEASAGRA